MAYSTAAFPWIATKKGATFPPNLNVYAISHYQYAADRLEWLYRHRRIIGGLEFIEEPPVLRFFAGRLKPKGDWGTALGRAFENDFGEGC